MSVPGERFELNLDSANDVITPHDYGAGTLFIKDILEKDNDNFVPPAPPKFKATQNGYPLPRVRGGPSRYKQLAKRLNAVPSKEKTVTFEESERKGIDEENKQRIRDMSPEDIERERKELLSALSGSLIERLLKRSNIDTPEDDFDKPLREQAEKDDAVGEIPMSYNQEPVPKKQITASKPVKEKKSVSFAAEPTSEPMDTMPATDILDKSSAPVHFPTAPVPRLDPSSNTFLQDLHQKYFSTLPFDPNTLSWMSAPDSDADPMAYSASRNSFSPAELRFDFSGNLLPPNLSHQIPTTMGLHHHGLAPEAAGYTINELSIYARSTVQAQRCMAFQTLGRFLFKLGTGIFGDDGGTNAQLDEDDWAAVLCRGLWEEVKKERILDTLVGEASKEKGLVRHQTAHAMAVEAVWLWEKGGGRWPERADMQDENSKTNDTTI